MIKMDYKIAVAFSISSRFGSELRSGYDLVSNAVKNGFNVLVISDMYVYLFVYLFKSITYCII
jgi:hypothetical protein